MAYFIFEKRLKMTTISIIKVAVSKEIRKIFFNSGKTVSVIELKLDGEDGWSVVW